MFGGTRRDHGRPCRDRGLLHADHGERTVHGGLERQQHDDRRKRTVLDGALDSGLHGPDGHEPANLRRFEPDDRDGLLVPGHLHRDRSRHGPGDEPAGHRTVHDAGLPRRSGHAERERRLLHVGARRVLLTQVQHVQHGLDRQESEPTNRPFFLEFKVQFTQWRLLFERSLAVLERVILLLHSALLMRRIAEISVPAWLMPMKKTKSMM